MLWKRYAENMHQQLIQDPFILVNSQKKVIPYKRLFFQNKIFGRRIIKNPVKS